jgi:HEAT repeat protein
MSLTAACAIALLALGVPSASAPHQAAARSSRERTKSAEEVAAQVRIMLLAIREGEPGSREIQTERLIGLGSAATPLLLQALESGLVPAAGPAAIGSAEPESMDEARVAAVIAALSRRGRAEVLQPAIALLERSTAVHTSAVAVRLLGAVGDRRELPRLCRTARPNPDEFVDGELTDAFEAAATEILKRDEIAPRTAHDLLRAEPESVRWSLGRALANAASEPALEVLAAELGAHPEDDVFVLDLLTRSCASIRSPIPESIVLPVRPYLGRGEPACAAGAARCLGAMEDAGSLEELIGLLRNGDPLVVPAAHAALVSITNVGLLPDAGRWEHWLAEETAWFRDEFPGLCLDLHSESAAVAFQAISRMAAHPAYRREIADALTLRLEDRPAAIRKLACSALRQLGARTAVPSLERWAEDPDRRLALEARRALAILAPQTCGVEASTTADDDAQAEPGSSR